MPYPPPQPAHASGAGCLQAQPVDEEMEVAIRNCFLSASPRQRDVALWAKHAVAWNEPFQTTARWVSLTSVGACVVVPALRTQEELRNRVTRRPI